MSQRNNLRFTRQEGLLIIVVVNMLAVLIAGISFYWFYYQGDISYASKDVKEDAAGVKYADEIPVLLYHHIEEMDKQSDIENMDIISREAFDEQMKILYENGFNTITLDELHGYVKGKIDIPQKSILISFDDGYRSNYIYAYPILKKYSFHAAIFLITSKIGYDIEQVNLNDYPKLSWKEFEKCNDVFEFASHTHDLHKLDSNNISHLLAEPKEAILRDLLISKKLLDTDSFAYPYGQYDEDAIELLQELGFKMAFTTAKGKIKVGDNPFILNRISIYADTSIEDFKEVLEIKR